MITISPTAEEKFWDLMQDTFGLRVYVKGGSSRPRFSFPI